MEIAAPPQPRRDGSPQVKAQERRLSHVDSIIVCIRLLIEMYHYLGICNHGDRCIQ